jgi:integrase
MPKLTKRFVEALPSKAQDYVVWCSELPRFGVRVYPSETKTFFVRCRVGAGKSQCHRLGVFGLLTAEEARKQAYEVIRSVERGENPRRERNEAKQAKTVAEVCELYQEAAEAGQVLTRFRRPKKAATVAIDRGRISRHIVPLLGRELMRDIRRADIQCMADQIAAGKTAGVFKTKLRGKAVVRGGAGTAARVVELLGGIFTWAEARGFCSGTNPAHGVLTALAQPKKRFLSPKEVAALGEALRKVKIEAPHAAAALKLIALTGLRSEEAIGLKWSEIDEIGHVLRLEDTKTGPSIRPVGTAVLAMLRDLPRLSETFVFPARNGEKPADLSKQTAAIFNFAKLHDVRSKELRRTFASVADDLGYSVATVGELLGHSHGSVTAKYYIRRSDDALLAAADRVSKRISDMLEGLESCNVVPLASGRPVQAA